jgi:hypothetical protein
MELQVNSVPATIDTNYEAVKEQLTKDIGKYDIVVTADTVKDAKKLAAQLNKVKAEISKRRKEEVAKATGPVKIFEDNVKSLEAMCEEGRQKIVAQVLVFEEKVLDRISVDLQELMDSMYKEREILPKHQSISWGDLVKLTAVTAAGKLSKATKEAMEDRVEQCFKNQRLAQLEAEAEAARAEAAAQERAREIIAEKETADRAEEERLSALQVEKEQAAESKRLKEESLRLAREAQALRGLDCDPPEDAAEEKGLLTPREFREQQGEPPVQAEAPPPAMTPIAESQLKPAGDRLMQIDVTLFVNAPPQATTQRVEEAMRKKLIAAGIEKSIQSIVATEVF